MKILSLIFILSIFTSDCNNMQEFKTQFHQIKTEEDLENFIEKAQTANCNELEPYLASAIMQTAEHAFLPTKKLKKFKQGKKMLEVFIETNPTNIEARYIRALVQSEIPRFLGYHNEIESDIEFVKLKIDASDIPKEYKKLILKNISEIK